jgi:hypothetical protein
MGSSSVTVQSVVDYISSMGELAPVLPTGGYSTLAAVKNANYVMQEMLAKPFNWKWNSFNLAPFYTISWQNDYWGLNITNIGWLENVTAIDINNTALPKPIYYPEAVRDFPVDAWASSPPERVCWKYNASLYPGVWPGNSVAYTNPLGQPQTPNNPRTNILDVYGNYLVLTTYGTTAASGNAPASATPWNPLSVTTIADGSCVWTLANPNGQGFRVGPLPPQQGVVYQINVVAQAKPLPILNLQAFINPIPDDYQSYFTDGMIAYTYKISSDPAIQARFPMMRQAWLLSMQEACRQGDRERDAACFVPQSSIMGNDMLGSGSMGPADPYNWAQRRGWGN